MITGTYHRKYRKGFVFAHPTRDRPYPSTYPVENETVQGVALQNGQKVLYDLDLRKVTSIIEHVSKVQAAVVLSSSLAYAPALGRHRRLVVQTQYPVGTRLLVHVNAWAGVRTTAATVLAVEGDPLAAVCGAFEYDMPDYHLPVSDLVAPNNVGRVNLTAHNTYTIDPPGCRDRDDAVTVVSRPLGGWRVGVHVTAFVDQLVENSPLDVEARRRATTVYLGTSNIPMLPRELSEGAWSLLPGCDRNAVTVWLEFDRTGAHVGARLQTRTRINVTKAFTYEEAATAPELDTLLQLVRMREPAVIDKVLQAHRAIEFLMIKANEAIAHHLREHPIPFRNHPPPRTLPPTFDHPVYTKYLETKVNASAYYAPFHSGHHALHLQKYVHATSPLRRYADVLVQRALLDTTIVPVTDAVCQHLTDASRKAQRAEDAYRLRVKQPSPIGSRFEALITRVTASFVYIFLPDLFSEHTLHVSKLVPRTRWVLYQDQLHTGNAVLKGGDTITVHVVGLDIKFGEIQLAMCN